MKKVKFIGIAVIAALGLSFAGCDNDKKDNNNTTLLLLAAKARMEAKAKAVAVSGSVSGGLPAAAGGTMTTAYNKALDQQKLMIAILNNGNDPVFAKEAVAGYITAQKLEKASPKAQLAAISIDAGYPQTVGNVKTYQFSGTIPSATVTVTSIPIGIFCDVRIFKKTGTTDAGYMEFGTGSTLKYTGSLGETSSFTGSAELNSVVTYNNFGFIYPDYATIIWMIKSPSISGICKAANSLAKYAIIKSGSVTTNMIADYSAANTANSFTSQASFKVTLNSPDGIVIQPNGEAKEVLVTLENVVYDYNSDISVNDSNLDGALVAGSIDGSLSLTFSGIVNGISIDETIEVNL